MPAPLRLPAQPDALVHLEQPGVLIKVMASSTGDQRGPHAIVTDAMRQGGQEFEAKLAPHLDVSKPWNAAIVGNQTIAYVPIRSTSATTVKQLLAPLPKEGPFGAVVVRQNKVAGYPRLAYFDAERDMLTLADDLRGLATGPELGRTYGKRPIQMTVKASTVAQFGLDMPMESLELKGDSPDSFTVVAHKLSQPIPMREQIANGALTGLLTKSVAVGATSKYANYRQEVDSINAQIRREVSRQNFLVRGVLEDMHSRFRTMAARWNGRVMVGSGPARHGRIGLGVDDAKKAENATLHFIAGLLANLSTARSIGLAVPRLRFARSMSSAGGVTIHGLAIPDARRIVPRELHAMVDDKNVLHLAFGFSPRAGAAMITAGPDAQSALKSWLAEAAKTKPGADSSDHLAAVSFAVNPAQLTPLQEQPMRAFGLTASGKSTRAVLKLEGDKTIVFIRREG